MSRLERADESAGGDQGALYGAGELPRYVPEGVQVGHVLLHAPHVRRVKRVLRVQDLKQRSTVVNIEPFYSVVQCKFSINQKNVIAHMYNVF